MAYTGSKDSYPDDMSMSELSDAETDLMAHQSYFGAPHDDAGDEYDADIINNLHQTDDDMLSLEDNDCGGPDSEEDSFEEQEYESRDFRTGHSALEDLPIELIQDIATYADSDFDLDKFSKSSPQLAESVNAARSDVWRRRFILKYDFPRVKDYSQFSVAYQLRRFVLRRLDGDALRNGKNDQAQHQLSVLQDMIIETYNPRKPHLQSPCTSKNLAAFGSPDNSPFMLSFMEVPLFANHKSKYGRPHPLFDTIHVTLSHLVLHPQSAISLRLNTSRGNYDLARVYNFNRPFKAICERLEDKKSPARPYQSTRFPNLQPKNPNLPVPRYKVCVHTLLHIRNFWQRHFTEQIQGIGENTYASMARNLVACDMSPRKWFKPLQEHIALDSSWVGHYSCFHPWPKSRTALEEGQTCAEDWGHIDPMTLKFETSATNIDDAFWPELFSTVPVFKQAMPDTAHQEMLHLTYIRGIAPFIQLKNRSEHTHDSNHGEKAKDKDPEYHPFRAARVHGFVHDIPDDSILSRKARKARFSTSPDHEMEEIIPGWKQIVMVIYKPTTRQLVSVLEFAEEAYGGASGTEMQFNTANVWADNPVQVADVVQPQTTAVNTNSTTVAHDDADHATGTDTIDSGNPTQPTDQDIEEELKKVLTKRLKSFTESYSRLVAEQNEVLPHISAHIPPRSTKTDPKEALPDLFSPKHIRQLEERFSAAQYMTWDDGTMEYAYAYEGVIIPGGKIMLGRWWRINGSDGLGPGKEVDPDGNGIELRPLGIEETASATDISGEGSTASIPRESKKRARKSSPAGRKRRSTRRGNLSRGNIEDSDIEGDDEHITDSEWEEEHHTTEDTVNTEKEPEFEYVTMLNGGESRAQNAPKGLERGPFVFWSY